MSVSNQFMIFCRLYKTYGGEVGHLYPHQPVRCKEWEMDGFKLNFKMTDRKVLYPMVLN